MAASAIEFRRIGLGRGFGGIELVGGDWPRAGLGQLPAVPYPAGLAATTVQYVAGLVGSLPEEPRKNFSRFFAKPPTAKAALAWHTTWGNLTWNTRTKLEAGLKKTNDGIASVLGLTFADEVMTAAKVAGGGILFAGGTVTGAAGAAAGIVGGAVLWPLAAAVGAFIVGTQFSRNLDRNSQRKQLANFFGEWAAFLQEYRRRWDVRYPTYQSLNAFLRSLPPDAPISVEASLELQRQTASYALMVRELAAGSAERVKMIGQLAVAYEKDQQLVSILREFSQNVGLVAGEALATAGTIIGSIIEDIVGPILKGAGKGLWRAIPWWVWVGGGVVALVALGPTISTVGRLVLSRNRQ